MENKDQKEKSSWTNEQWDSTIFMAIILIAFGIFIYMLATNNAFSTSDAADKLMLIFAGAITVMANYFFDKMKKRNGNGGTHS